MSCEGCRWRNNLIHQVAALRCYTAVIQSGLWSRQVQQQQSYPLYLSIFRIFLFIRQRLWLRLGVNVDDQLWLRLNLIPIRNCNPSANPSPCRNTSTNPNPNPNPNRPTTPLLTLPIHLQVNNNDLITNRRTITNGYLPGPRCTAPACCEPAGQ